MTEQVKTIDSYKDVVDILAEEFKEKRYDIKEAEDYIFDFFNFLGSFSVEFWGYLPKLPFYSDYTNFKSMLEYEKLDEGSVTFSGVKNTPPYKAKENTVIFCFSVERFSSFCEETNTISFVHFPFSVQILFETKNGITSDLYSFIVNSKSVLSMKQATEKKDFFKKFKFWK